ncbi:MAG: tetratricopeptide repeat protein [Planctomycetes bacterium]|nr:tetratricopeptide repeat protein [Planctomycetota bacterium]
MSRLHGPVFCLVLTGVLGAAGCAAPVRWQSGARPLSRDVGANQERGEEATLTSARHWERSGDSEQAREAYQTLVSANPRHTIAHHRLGVLLAKEGQYQRAEDHLLTALESDPENVNLLNDLGYCRQLQDRYEEAAAAYREALLIEPSHRTTRNNLTSLMSIASVAAAGEQTPRLLETASDSQIVPVSGVEDEGQKHAGSTLEWRFADEPAAPEADVTPQPVKSARAIPSPSLKSVERPASPQEAAPLGEAPLVRFVEMSKSPAATCAGCGTSAPSTKEHPLRKAASVAKSAASEDAGDAVEEASSAAPSAKPQAVVSIPAPRPASSHVQRRSTESIFSRGVLRTSRDDEGDSSSQAESAPGFLVERGDANRPPAPSSTPVEVHTATAQPRPHVTSGRRTLFDALHLTDSSPRSGGYRRTSRGGGSLQISSQTRTSRRNEGVLDRIFER